MREVISGILMMVVAALSASAFSSHASAEVKPADIKVDYVNQKITVSTSSDSKLHIAKATVTVKKVKKTNSEVTTVKTGSATEYDLLSSGNKKTGTIDISSYPVTKDTYLSIWGEMYTEPILVKLPAVNTKLQATVDSVNTTVTIKDIRDKKNPMPIADPLEYCTVNGTWIDYEVGKTDLTGYTALGATLRFRVKAQRNQTLGAHTIEIGTDADGNSIKAYTTEVGNFASNEYKVKIPKKAAGPKATFDYVNHLIKVPKTCEYRVQNYGSLGTFTAVEGTTKTVALKVEDLMTKGCMFDIRTAATDKKPASKITEYDIGGIPSVVAQTSQGTGFRYTSQDVMDSRIMNPYGSMTGGVDNLADFQVTKITSGKTVTMTVKNGTTDAYQFIVADAQSVSEVSELKLPAITDKVTQTVSAGKTASIKVKFGQYVYIRRAANTKNRQWSSPYTFFGQVITSSN